MIGLVTIHGERCRYVCRRCGTAWPGAQSPAITCPGCGAVSGWAAIWGEYLSGSGYRDLAQPRDQSSGWRTAFTVLACVLATIFALGTIFRVVAEGQALPPPAARSGQTQATAS